MSKILEAVKKRGPVQGDFSYHLATVDGMDLFPLPAERQLHEFEMLANTLLNRHSNTHGHVVTFSSMVAGEGCSYISYNVARHLAFMLGRKIAWVDANFKRPQKSLEGQGITFRSLLKDPDMFSEVKTGGNLTLIPNGDEHIKTTDLLTGDSYLRLIEHFQSTFYFTIVDTPPILESVDAGRLAAPTLGDVIVLECRRLKYEVVQYGIDLLREQQVEILGTVLNRRPFDIPSFLYGKI